MKSEKATWKQSFRRVVNKIRGRSRKLNNDQIILRFREHFKVSKVLLEKALEDDRTSEVESIEKNFHYYGKSLAELKQASTIPGFNLILQAIEFYAQLTDQAKATVGCITKKLLVSIGQLISSLVSTTGEVTHEVSPNAIASMLTCIDNLIVQDDEVLQALALESLKRIYTIAPKKIELESSLQLSMLSDNFCRRKTGIIFLHQILKRDIGAVLEMRNEINLIPDNDYICRGLEEFLLFFINSESSNNLRLEVEKILLFMVSSCSESQARKWVEIVKEVLVIGNNRRSILTSGDSGCDEESNLTVLNRSAGSEEAVSYEFNWRTRIAALAASRMIMNICDQQFIQDNLFDFIRIAFVAATSDNRELWVPGLLILEKIINSFMTVSDPEFPDQSILEQYETQISTAILPAIGLGEVSEEFNKGCQVAALWLTCGVLDDVNKLRRVYQPLIYHLRNFEGKSHNVSISNLPLLKAWADIYVKGLAEKQWSPIFLSIAHLLFDESIENNGFDINEICKILIQVVCNYLLEDGVAHSNCNVELHLKSLVELSSSDRIKEILPENKTLIPYICDALSKAAVNTASSKVLELCTNCYRNLHNMMAKFSGNEGDYHTLIISLDCRYLQLITGGLGAEKHYMFSTDQQLVSSIFSFLAQIALTSKSAETTTSAVNVIVTIIQNNATRKKDCHNAEIGCNPLILQLLRDFVCDVKITTLLETMLTELLDLVHVEHVDTNTVLLSIIIVSSAIPEKILKKNVNHVTRILSLIRHQLQSNNPQTLVIVFKSLTAFISRVELHEFVIKECVNDIFSPITRVLQKNDFYNHMTDEEICCVLEVAKFLEMLSSHLDIELREGLLTKLMNYFTHFLLPNTTQNWEQYTPIVQRMHTQVLARINVLIQLYPTEFKKILSNDFDIRKLLEEAFKHATQKPSEQPKQKEHVLQPTIKLKKDFSGFSTDG